MSILIAFGIVVLSIALAAVMVAKKRGTDIVGLFSVDVSKYTTLLDKVE